MSFNRSTTAPDKSIAIRGQAVMIPGSASRSHPTTQAKDMGQLVFPDAGEQVGSENGIGQADSIVYKSGW